MNLVISIVLWLSYFVSLYFAVFWFLTYTDSKEIFKEQEKKKRKLIKFPFVSIIIPAYNEEEHIASTLQSVIKINYSDDKYEILVINDGSTDNTAKIVNKIIKENPQLSIKLFNRKNHGKANSLNFGMEKARGEFFSCLDADSFVDSEILNRMLYVFENDDKDLAIVTPAMKVQKPKTFLQKIQQIEYFTAIFITRLMGVLDCIYVAPGPFSLYRKSTIKEIGGFDEQNLTEDMEIAYRTQSKNYKIKQCHDAYVFTYTPKKPKELYHQRNRWLKGGLLNAIKYRHLLFNKKFGDFGFVMMGLNYLVYFLAFNAVLFFGYLSINPLIKQIKKFFLVDFEFLPYFKDIFKLNFDFLSLDITKFFVIGIMLTISIFMLYKSYRNANEKMNDNGVIHLIPYFFIYYLFLSFIAVFVMFELVRRKKQKW